MNFARVRNLKVLVRHRMAQRRGLLGKVVGSYGGEEHVVVDVRFPDGMRRLFWPEDLEEVASPRPSGGAPFLVAKAGARGMEGLGFAECDYHLDESDPDVVILRRQDGPLVARFSARGATKEGIVEAAKEDYGELLLRARTNPLLGRQSEGSSSS